MAWKHANDSLDKNNFKLVVQLNCKYDRNILSFRCNLPNEGFIRCVIGTGRQTEHFDGNLPELMSSLWEKLCIVGGGGYARVVDRFSIQLSVNYCRYRNHRQTHVWRGMWHSRYGCHLFCCCTPTLPLVLRYIWMAGHFGKSPIGCPDQ